MAGNAIGESNITMSGFLIYDTNSAKVNVSTSNGFRTGYRLSAFNGTRGLYYAGLLGIGAGSNTVATYLAPPGSDTTTTNDNVLFTDAQPYLSDYVSGSYVGGVGFDNTAVSATSQGSNLNTAGASSIYHTSGSVYCQDGSTTYCGYVQRCTPVCAHTHRRHVHTIVVCLAVCQQLIRPAAAARRSPLPRQSSSVLFVGTGGAQQPSSSSSSSSLHQQLCRRPPLLFVGPPPLQPLPLSTALAATSSSSPYVVQPDQLPVDVLGQLQRHGRQCDRRVQHYHVRLPDIRHQLGQSQRVHFQWIPYWLPSVRVQRHTRTVLRWSAGHRRRFQHCRHLSGSSRL